MIGLSDWPGPPTPVIITPDAADMPAIAANYPRASVLAIPADCAHLVAREAWGAFLPLYGADLTLWPVNPSQFPLMAALVPVLGDAGVRTLRLATRALDDYARLQSLRVLWRDRAPHPGPPAGLVLTLAVMRAERQRAAAALVAREVRNPAQKP
jgi:hypothetical protein